MTLEALILSLYLFFPSLNPMQEQLTKSLNLDTYVFQDVMQQRNQLSRLYAQYFPESENQPFYPDYYADTDEYAESSQKWILKELENPKFDSMSESLSFIAGLSENGQSISEIVYLASNQNLRQFEYGAENLSLNYLNDSSTEIVNANDDTITLTQYDENYHLIEKTVWKNSKTSLEDMKMISRARYEYKKTESDWALDGVSEESFLGNIQVQTVYDQDLNPISIKNYDTSSGSKKLSKVINRTYNKDRQITSEETIEYGKIESRKKNVFKYTTKADFPDYDFYEDGILRIRTIYKSNKDYSQEIFFDDDYRVLATYENNKKVLEQIFIGDMELRRNDEIDE